MFFLSGIKIDSKRNSEIQDRDGKVQIDSAPDNQGENPKHTRKVASVSSKLCLADALTKRQI